MSPDSAKSSPDATSPEKGVLSDSQESQEDNSPQKKKKKSARRKKKNGEEGTEGMLCPCLLVHVDFIFNLGQMCRIKLYLSTVHILFYENILVKGYFYDQHLFFFLSFKYVFTSHFF